MIIRKRKKFETSSSKSVEKNVADFKWNENNDLQLSCRFSLKQAAEQPCNNERKKEKLENEMARKMEFSQ